MPRIDMSLQKFSEPLVPKMNRPRNTIERDVGRRTEKIGGGKRVGNEDRKEVSRTKMIGGTEMSRKGQYIRMKDGP